MSIGFGKYFIDVFENRYDEEILKGKIKKAT